MAKDARKCVKNVVSVAYMGWAVACAPEAPDVLREFPPPRLAKLAPNVPQREHTLEARCAGEVEVRTRTDSTTIQLRGAHGTFELRGKSEVEATLSVPLPAELTDNPAKAGAALSWNVIETRSRSESESTFNHTATGAPRDSEKPHIASVSVAAELEYNRVRSRSVHLLEFEAEEPFMPPSKVHLLRLALDPVVHRLKFPAAAPRVTNGRPMTDAGPLRRADITLHCGLAKSDRSQP